MICEVNEERKGRTLIPPHCCIKQVNGLADCALGIPFHPQK